VPAPTIGVGRFGDMTRANKNSSPSSDTRAHKLSHPRRMPIAHVAHIFGVSADKGAITRAMEIDLPVRIPSSRRRQRTAPWQLLNICAGPAARCCGAMPAWANCVTGKSRSILETASSRNAIDRGRRGDLAFLIHFVGDIHHLSMPRTSGPCGNCVTVDSHGKRKRSSPVWDNDCRGRLEPQASIPTARDDGSIG